MATTTWLVFAALSVTAVLTPGPAMLAILGHALTRGAPATWPVVVGNAAGAAALIAAAAVGMSSAFAALPHGLTILTVAGIAYLAHLGIQTWRRADAPVDTPVMARSAAIHGFGRGVGIAMSNPKALLFFGTVIPQFVDPSRPLVPQIAILIVTFASFELVATTTVTLGVHAIAPLIARPSVTRRLRRGGAVMMLIAAAVMALQASR